MMDAICSLAATQVAQDQRLAHCHSMLQQIMTHLGIQHVPVPRDEPTVAASASTDPPKMLQIHHHHNSEVVNQLFQLPTNFD